MSQKKFQQHSEYEDYDLDGDGIVTDEEDERGIDTKVGFRKIPRRE